MKLFSIILILSYLILSYLILSYLILFYLSSTYLHAEKLEKEKIEAYVKLIENYRTAEQNLENYLSGIHSAGQVSFKHQMRIADLLCDVGKAQKPMIEFMKLNKERFRLKKQDVMNIFPHDRQKLQEELEELKDTPYECGKQSYKHLL